MIGAISQIDNTTIWESTVGARAERGTGIGTEHSEPTETISSIGFRFISDSQIDSVGTCYCCGLGSGSSGYRAVSAVDHISI
jgi:hypothetical protein